MTETIDSAAAEQTPKKRGGLNSLLLADLKSMAGGLGIAGASGMKKAQLVDAIKAAQSGGGASASGTAPARRARKTTASAEAPAAAPEQSAPADAAAERPARTRRARQADGDAQTAASGGNGAGPATDESAPSAERAERPARRRDRQQADSTETTGSADDAGRSQGDAPREQRGDQREGRGNRDGQGNQDRNQDRDRNQGNRNQGGNQDRQGGNQDRQGGNQDRQGGNQDRQDRQGGNQDRQGGNQGQRNQDRGGNQGPQSNRDDEGGRRSRRRRGRDRDGGGGGNNRDRSGRGGREPDTTILEDDVLVPAAGILDVLDSYAFVRTSGYLPAPEDVYLSLPMVRKMGLRRGDAIVGQVRQPREGERKEKFNPMVRVDSVNGDDPEKARNRPEFAKLTPLYASERLRLETDQHNLIGRVIDIAAPIGKGQRGLIVSPAKAGKTMVMQSIANSITRNNPECHLMVVLVDERPEEVTDFERSVKGEVISSTFDRPAGDHTTVAELAIERAKRLVELGHDVVVLLDGITRLGRAYNLAAPPSGRILSGGVDSAALYPPKKFFGAARNIENGGSLTILATALIESGSKMDEVIFEEFKGTGNMEIRLRREFAEKRIFPAIDAVQSGTRREELLLGKDELAIIWKVRRLLSGLDGQQALELLLERLKKSQSNIEFLMQVQKTMPGAGENGH
ncbi:transcription termination factor Rho [Nocardioides zeae]|uniref:Transcription termination factor Rho n=1 Tax=Nocardioides zeae TaxID=1457234 RepID=A0ACC6IH17_9ACTN|nr:transcription termination factor Rho [Nocardioides zeae]MDR6172956.1 transcription termination factor Rho [Nocardioides zeae]MDR6209950.1 transcription termination factor Rho [Nocardioides zeae]